MKNYYLVLSSGGIFSTKTNRILKPFISNSGYEVVSICDNNATKKYSVHRLVAEAYIENIDNKEWVNHKDGNKLNNSSNNLEWVTAAENNQHSYKTGLNIPKRGEDHFAAKLSNAQVLEIKELLKQGWFYTPIAKKYNVSTTIIGMIKRGQRRLYA